MFLHLVLFYVASASPQCLCSTLIKRSTKLNKSTCLIQTTYPQQKNQVPPIKLCSSGTFGNLTRGLTLCQYCVSPRFVPISSSTSSLFKQPQKFQSFWQDFIPAPTAFWVNEFYLDVVIIAPQPSGDPTLLLSCMHRVLKSWEEVAGSLEALIQEVVADTCDCVNCSNRLFVRTA